MQCSSLVAKRVAVALAPQLEQPSRDGPNPVLDTYQGISFENWLDLFLDYAIGLAIAHRRDEAYRVCEAARDSTVFQSPEHDFVIHVAWGGKVTTNVGTIMPLISAQYVPFTPATKKSVWPRLGIS